jgi:hypothetical protein
VDGLLLFYRVLWTILLVMPTSVACPTLRTVTFNFMCSLRVCFEACNNNAESTVSDESSYEAIAAIFDWTLLSRMWRISRRARSTITILSARQLSSNRPTSKLPVSSDAAIRA